MKQLYKGTFNWCNESYELFTHANSPDSAYLNFIGQLHKKIKFSQRSIMMYFDGSKDNYFIRRYYHESKNGKEIPT